jgi:hypothetical protein
MTAVSAWCLVDIVSLRPDKKEKIKKKLKPFRIKDKNERKRIRSEQIK